jgi:LAS superfamily LD-carboxypeptidase LdcB
VTRDGRTRDRGAGRQVSPFSAATLRTFPATFESLDERGLLTPVMTLGHLRAALSADQRAVVDQVMSLRPRDYGVRTPYAGQLEPVPRDLVRVTGREYTVAGRQMPLGATYVPRHVYEAYVRMNDAFTTQQPGRMLLIGSCYRSPAYQVVVFLNRLINGYHGDIVTTIRHASPPNYSQHTIASKAAIDFMNVDGSPSDDHPEDFRHTAEYTWLRHRAGEFHFYESWQEGNEFGMRAEPWHWQYRPERQGSIG